MESKWTIDRTYVPRGASSIVGTRRQNAVQTLGPPIVAGNFESLDVHGSGIFGKLRHFFGNGQTLDQILGSVQGGETGIAKGKGGYLGMKTWSVVDHHIRACPLTQKKKQQPPPQGRLGASTPEYYCLEGLLYHS